MGAITSKIGVSTTSQAIWKVCTFPVRSYVQHKEALRGGCEIECKSRGGKPEILEEKKTQKKKKIPKTSPNAITSRIRVSTTSQPIWKVCTFPVRSYVQHKEALRSGCEIECKPRGGKPGILVAFRVQGWKLPRS